MNPHLGLHFWRIQAKKFIHRDQLNYSILPNGILPRREEEKQKLSEWGDLQNTVQKASCK